MRGLSQTADVGRVGAPSGGARTRNRTSLARATRLAADYAAQSSAQSNSTHPTDPFLGIDRLVVRKLVGFMYFEEAMPTAKCDTPANT
jgi:hypothetical protein